MTIAIGYVRVSTDEQALGPESQRSALEAWAKARDVTLASVHEDLGVSGAAPAADRPGLLAALSALREAGADVLLVAKRDRLARDVVEAALTERLVESAGGRVLSAAGEGTDTHPDDPTGLLMRRLIDAFAEYERAMIRARTRAALAVKRERGELIGSVPFGSRLAPDGRTLEEDPDEAAVVRLARKLRAAGYSLRAVAVELTHRGHASRSGRPFAASQISRMLVA